MCIKNAVGYRINTKTGWPAKIFWICCLCTGDQCDGPQLLQRLLPCTTILTTPPYPQALMNALAADTPYKTASPDTKTETSCKGLSPQASLPKHMASGQGLQKEQTAVQGSTVTVLWHRSSTLFLSHPHLLRRSSCTSPVRVFVAEN